MGVNRAAEQFNVPRTTLKDWLSGRVEHGSKSGPAPYLNKHEEEHLVEFPIQMTKIGYGNTKQEVITIVKWTIEKKGLNVKKFNGEGWWTWFKQRNPSLWLRTANPLAMVHSDGTRQEVIDKYFKLLKGTLESLNPSNKPQYIYNMDETGIPLDAKQLKRVAPKGMKKVHGRSSGNKTQITVVVRASASGTVIPPMVIFKGERLNHNLTKGEVPGTLYGLSEMDGSITSCFIIGETTTSSNTYHPQDQSFCYWMATPLISHLRRFRHQKSKALRSSAFCHIPPTKHNNWMSAFSSLWKVIGQHHLLRALLWRVHSAVINSFHLLSREIQQWIWYICWQRLLQVA